MSAQTIRRHLALRHRLPPNVASQSASSEWIHQRAAHYAQVAGLAPLVVVCDPDHYELLTGRMVPASLWGDADYRARLLFVDPTRCATKAGAELVVVHEIAHHRWPSYGHRPIFFERCQHLIDTAEA